MITNLTSPRWQLSNGDANLTISTTERSDSGSFHCVAENGNITAGYGGRLEGSKAFLTVEGERNDP